ncbi:MAG TPA: hypothetical protein VIF60_20585 [Burkholderiaceae bacterium]
MTTIGPGDMAARAFAVAVQTDAMDASACADKHQVRCWMKQRLQERSPLPEIEQIQSAIGWVPRSNDAS